MAEAASAVFKCPNCDFTAKNKGGLTRHTNSKHGDKTSRRLSISDNGAAAAVDSPPPSEIVKSKQTEIDWKLYNECINASVSNREQLKSKMHEIHNFLRNNGFGYGISALRVFNVLYGLKKLEDYKLLEKLELNDPACRFSNLVELSNGTNPLDPEKLTEYILKNTLDALYGHPKLKHVLFYEIPKKIKSNKFGPLIKHIDEISKIEKSCNVQLAGKIYEYFIGREDSAITELGAYFTDRHIIDYIYKKYPPRMKPGAAVLPSMIDPFAGSGGFTTGFIRYFNEHPEYKESIYWKIGRAHV